MKIVSKPIKVMAVFGYDKEPTPYKFKHKLDDESEQLIYIDKIIRCERIRRSGIETIMYECQSAIDGIETRYTLKFIVASCKWQLYAI